MCKGRFSRSNFGGGRNNGIAGGFWLRQLRLRILLSDVLDLPANTRVVKG
jgi:hypothetical protein